MKRPKVKVLIVSSNPPLNDMGGSLLLYRQFIQSSDYSVAVITDKPESSPDDGIPWMQVEHPRWIKRLQRTRLSLWAHDYVHLYAGHRVPKDVANFARSYSPDIILTGAETWLCDLGIRLAKLLHVPVGGYFMDWPSYASIAHKPVKNYLSTVFRRRYQRCDLALGICPEMLEALGTHKNAHVYYPSGSWPDNPPELKKRKPGEPFTLLFGGNLGQWYGQALQLLINALDRRDDLAIKIAGKNARWNKEEEEILRKKGTYLGFLNKAEYKHEIEKADAVLVIMGFGEENRLIESTSFKSKMVDYFVQRRPMVIWGPEYCTAVRHGKREKFAEIVQVTEPKEIVKVMEKLAENPLHGDALVEYGDHYFQKFLNSTMVFEATHSAILKTIKNY